MPITVAIRRTMPTNGHQAASQPGAAGNLLDSRRWRAKIRPVRGQRSVVSYVGREMKNYRAVLRAYLFGAALGLGWAVGTPASAQPPDQSELSRIVNDGIARKTLAVQEPQ